MRVRKVAGTRVRAVLKLLATQAGFMLNPLVSQSVESMPEEYGEVTRAESMLKGEEMMMMIMLVMMMMIVMVMSMIMMIMIEMILKMLKMI
jgi:hypothetical protein